MNLGVGDAAGKPPHLVGEALLKHFGIKPGTREAHAFTYLDFDRRGRGVRHAPAASRTSRRWSSSCAPTRPGALLLDGGDTLAGLGDGAVDEGPGHDRRAASSSAST